MGTPRTDRNGMRDTLRRSHQRTTRRMSTPQCTSSLRRQMHIRRTARTIAHIKHALYTAMHRITYFQLQSEDWRWWWSALLTAGSTGVYVAVYSVFYYNYRSYMSGVLQAAVFFGYVSVVSYSFVLMLGATGWWATYMFLGKIYGAIKSE